jgi:hypothetical protein
LVYLKVGIIIAALLLIGNDLFEEPLPLQRNRRSRERKTRWFAESDFGMTFGQFYAQGYLRDHPKGLCRLFHLLGVVASAAFLAFIVWLGVWWLLVLLPVPAYLLSWIGHLLVPNRPTTFGHPVWSFVGYWKLVGSIVTGTADL